VVLACARPALGQDFWAHWGDGKAELNGYRLTEPRYGANRKGSVVLVFVTEDFSDSLRVKADPGKHPATDVYPVLKLNLVRDFQTGIYNYNAMTSAFARVAPGWPVAKVSFSSQEWCGQVWHQIAARGAEILEHALGAGLPQVEDPDRVRGGRSTQVSVRLQYAAPAGHVGAVVAGVLGHDPAQTIREDLRRLKQVLEGGEVPRADATIRGGTR
jgi:hypothetical protein